jgi:hypothetical protein
MTTTTSTRYLTVVSTCGSFASDWRRAVRRLSGRSQSRPVALTDLRVALSHYDDATFAAGIRAMTGGDDPEYAIDATGRVVATTD